MKISYLGRSMLRVVVTGYCPTTEEWRKISLQERQESFSKGDWCSASYSFLDAVECLLAYVSEKRSNRK